MYRKIMSYLKEYKSSEHRKPLILEGARQVGKTYAIKLSQKNFGFEDNKKIIPLYAAFCI